MSFNILLQINNSDKIVLSKKIITIATLSGTLRNETSIMDPVILIAGDISNYVNCNYMSIPVFGRSYFVRDIKSIRSDLFEVHAHVDVLTTYASQIRNNQAIVRRQQNLWNLYLDDGSFRVYQNPMVLTKEFPAGFTTQEFVLSIAGA
jgi:hypothetical protein